MTASALYEGVVVHRRFGAVERSFRYPVWMAMVDLDELPGVFDAHPLWSARRPAPVRFRAADVLDAGPRSLAGVARELAAGAEGAAPSGAVRVLSTPRFCGVGFNPVRFVYLHGDDGRVDGLIAQVTNTPWGDTHPYAARREPGAKTLRSTFRKRLHVSPFMPMDQRYEIEATDPGEALRVSIASYQDGRPAFEALLAMRRTALTRASMTRVMLRYPPAAVATLIRIYAQAARLRLRGAPRFSRPRPPAPRPLPARARPEVASARPQTAPPGRRW
jgi:DUF1365 family protein